ncbi:MAG: hypothetical protein AB2989_04120 [Candidatus Symbiodolus clandestinus]
MASRITQVIAEIFRLSGQLLGQGLLTVSFFGAILQEGAHFAGEGADNLEAGFYFLLIEDGFQGVAANLVADTLKLMPTALVAFPNNCNGFQIVKEPGPILIDTHKLLIK